MSRHDIRPYAFGLNLLAYTLVACVLGAGISGTSMMMNRAMAAKAGRPGASPAQGARRHAAPAIVGGAGRPAPRG